MRTSLVGVFLVLASSEIALAEQKISVPASCQAEISCNETKRGRCVRAVVIVPRGCAITVTNPGEITEESE